jgi:hypothetical protein
MVWNAPQDDEDEECGEDGSRRAHGQYPASGIRFSARGPAYRRVC